MQPPPSGYNDPAPRKRSSYAWLWIALGIIVVCGCGGIGLIGAVLFPVFSRARIKIQTETCLSNVKHIAAASAMYATDNDDRLPPADHWIDGLTKYVTRERTFSCPAVLRPSMFGNRRRGEYGYAVNKLESEAKLATVRDRSTAIWVFESRDLVRNEAADPAKSPDPNRHGPGRSVAYLDGHAQFVSPSKQD